MEEKRFVVMIGDTIFHETVTVGTQNDVINVLENLIDAVKSGEYDDDLEDE